MKRILLVAGLFFGSGCGLMAKVNWYSTGTFNKLNPRAKACPSVCQNRGGTWTGGATIGHETHRQFGLCECNVADDGADDHTL